MKTTTLALLTAVLTATFTLSPPAAAAPKVKATVMKVNGVVASNPAGAAGNGVVTLFGFAHDGLTAASSVTLKIRNGSQVVDVAARSVYEPAAFDSAAQLAPDMLLSTTAGSLSSAGWMAAIDTTTLSSGQWVAESVQVVFGGATTNVAWSELQAGAWSFVSLGGSAPGLSEVIIVAQSPLNPAFSGALPPGFTMQSIAGLTLPSIPLPLVRLSVAPGDARKLVSRNYPAIPSGTYKMHLPGVNAYGAVSSREFGAQFTYTRPTITAFVDTPTINDPTYDASSGIAAFVGLISPFNGEPIVGDTQARNTTSPNGATATVPFDAASRTHLFSVDRDGPIQQTFWIQMPDAPDVTLNRRAWNPAEAFAPKWTARTYTADIEMADYPFAWVPAKAGGCASPIYLNSTGGDLPEGVVPLPNAKSRVYCAARWNTPPPSLAFDQYKVLAGKLPLSANGLSLSYDLGLIYFNRAAQAWRFASSLSDTVPLAVVDQQEPVAAFQPDYAVRALRGLGTGLVTFVGSNKLAGQLVLTGNVPSAEFTAQVVGSVRKTTSTRAKVLVPVLTDTTTTSEADRVTVEAWWSDTPARKYTYDLDFTSIPAEPGLLLLKVNDLLTTLAPSFVVRFGVRARDGTNSYNVNRDGAWAFTAQRFDSKTNLWQDLGSSTSTQLTPGGDLVINAAAPLSKGQHRLRVTARLSNNAAYDKVIFASAMIVFVNDGTSVAANLFVTPDAGPASVERPLLIRMYAQLASLQRVSDVQSVLWEQSDDDGDTWSSVVGAGAGFTTMTTLSTTVNRLYRATLASRFLADPYVTTPVRVVTFTPLASSITGPRVSVLGSGPVVFFAQVDQTQGPAVFSWSATGDWSGAATTAFTGATSAFTFTPTRVGNYIVKLLTRQADAPITDIRAVTTRQVVLTVVAPTLPLPRIEAPGLSNYEIGAPYTFRSHVPTLPASTRSLQDKVRMAWTTPQGDIVPTVDNGELVVRFGAAAPRLQLRVWLDGNESSASTATFTPAVWQYNLPEYVLVSSGGLDSPALLQITAKPMSTARLDVGATLTANWQIPPGATLVSNNGLTATVRLITPGPNTVSLAIQDSRGNSRTSSMTVDVLPPKPLDFVVTGVTQTDQYGRAPFNAILRINILAVPKDDPIVTVETTINGAVHATGGYNGAATYGVRVASEGTHTITITLRTRSGVWKTQSQTVVAVEPPTPECTIAYATGVRGDRTYTATCTVTVGLAPNLKWIVNNNTFPTAYGKTLSISQHEISSVQKITLLAETDKGKTAIFVWTP